MDWSPLMGLDITNGFSKPQVLFLGGLTLTRGIFGELARRRNDAALGKEMVR